MGWGGELGEALCGTSVTFTETDVKLSNSVMPTSTLRLRETNSHRFDGKQTFFFAKNYLKKWFVPRILDNKRGNKNDIFQINTSTENHITSKCIENLLIYPGWKFSLSRIPVALNQSRSLRSASKYNI